MKNSKSTLALFFSLVLLLSSCTLNNMVNKYNTVSFDVKPKQVEVHGGKIAIELEVTFPEKYFGKTASATFKAMLGNGDSEMVSFKEITLQGESISSNGITIGYVTGGKFTYSDEIDYNEGMLDHNLYASVNASVGKQSKELGIVKIADGVMATSTLVQDSEISAVANHNYEEETILNHTATIYFTVNQSNVRYSQKSSDEIKKLKEFAKLGYKTHSIEITSFASPEGSLDINDKVSSNREKSTYRYAQQLMRQLKVDGAKDQSKYVKMSKGEDWNGFDNLVRSSSMKDKNKILNIVKNQKDPQKREESIRDMAEIYDALEEDVLPKLRKATITLKVYEPKKTQEEIANLSTSDPSKLDIKELLYSATLTNDASTKENIYKSATELFANDYRAYNNLACLSLDNGDLEKANMYLEQASTRTSNASEVLENYGIIAAQKGNLEKAQTLYSQSNANSINKGILEIRLGNYASATNKLKGKDFNSVLAQVLYGNNSMYTLDKSTHGNYLNAIVSQRAGNNTKAIEYLSKSVSNKDLKVRTSKDIEFKNLSSNSDFMNLVK